MNVGSLISFISFLKDRVSLMSKLAASLRDFYSTTTTLLLTEIQSSSISEVWTEPSLR